jgi:hypothetical protein
MDSLRETLNKQYAWTQTSADGSVVKAGAVLVLQRSGLMMNAIAIGVPRSNTYSNGKISQGWLGRTADRVVTVEGSAATDQRQFVANESLWVTGIDVKKGGIDFHLYSEPYDGIHYFGQLHFPFQKGVVPTPNDALAMISEALAVDQGNRSANDPQVAQPLGEGKGGRSSSVYGVWVHPWITNAQLQQQQQLQLNPDGTFSEPSRAGGRNSGRFTVSGDQLMLTGLRPRNYRYTYIIQGDKIYLDHVAGDTLNWVRPQDTSPPQPTAQAQPKLPAAYANAQNPADKLQLNGDNTFSLQESGQAYQGTFVLNDHTVELNITGGPKTTATIRGNDLVDSGGQAWVLVEQPSQGASGAAVLQNQDIIKLVKAGLDDGLIIAKIGASKCQFDTSTDALIQLKESGVSAAVMKVIVAATK